MKKKNRQYSTENTKNTFFAKAIENWLTNTNELGYQLPFCQLLLNEGFRTVHISKHNAFEQGKDIIAIDPNGVTHLYQLKGGNVTLSLWRNPLKAEIDELIDLTVVHPSVDKTAPFVPYLVTNGYLDDTVRLQIENLNCSKWKKNPLQVILLPDLLTRFIKWSYEFTPQEIKNYRTFLELYFADGTAPVDEPKLASLLENILNLDGEKTGKAERKRNISAAVLLAGYAMAPQTEKSNYVSIIQTLTLLAAYILAVAEKFKLKPVLWKPSFDLVWQELLLNCERHEKQVQEGAYERIFEDLWDGELAPYRRHLATSYLFAHKLAQFIENDEAWRSFENDPILLTLTKSLVVAGEGSLIGFVFAHFYFNNLGLETQEELLIAALYLLIYFNGKNGKFGLPSPYHGIETAIKVNLGILEEDELREDFLGRSFFMESILYLLTIAGRRDVLEALWRQISYIQMEKFVPREPYGWFQWRTSKGENKSEFPRPAQSWSELQKGADEFDITVIPETLRQVPYFLPFFLLVYPHRVQPHTIKYLAQLLTPADQSDVAK